MGIKIIFRTRWETPDVPLSFWMLHWLTDDRMENFNLYAWLRRITIYHTLFACVNFSVSVGLVTSVGVTTLLFELTTQVYN